MQENKALLYCVYQVCGERRHVDCSKHDHNRQSEPLQQNNNEAMLIHDTLLICAYSRRYDADSAPVKQNLTGHALLGPRKPAAS